MRETLDDLLSQWEQGYERGQPPSAEMLCAEHPELLEELKSQIEAIQAIESKFGKLVGQPLPDSESAVPNRRLNQRLQMTSEFQVDRLHASGGLGEVYLASESTFNRQVAVKFPRQDRLNSQQVARFEREAQITGRLNHPGIVPVFSLGQDGSQHPCYVMRFVDGLTLKQRIEQVNQQSTSSVDYFATLEFRQLMQSFVALCNIVAYAHDQGIIHRDIKPENIILGPFGETMLMDWGLAKILNEPAENLPPLSASSTAETVSNKALKTVDGQVMGTPAYASPEQMRGRVDLTDSRSDIYSLGATLHFLLTGNVARKQNPPPSLSHRNALTHRNGSIVPNRLAAICRKAMADEIEDRYQSVASMRQDIERYLAGEAISVVPETAWSRFVRSVRRRPGLAATVLVGVSTAILAGLVGSLMLNQKNRELNSSNKQLVSALDAALVAKQRATSMADILENSLLAATPEQLQGKEATVRQLLDNVSEQLRSENQTNFLVAADTHTVLAQAYCSLGAFELAQEHADLGFEIYDRVLGPNSPEALVTQAYRARILSSRDCDAEAIKLAGDALKRGRKIESLDPDSLITLIDDYANACGFGPSPDHNQILALNREAYEISTKELGPNHRTTLNMASNLAGQLTNARDLEGAEKLLNEVHNAHETLLGSRHPETLVDILNLIALKFNQGDFQAANELCQSHLKTIEEVFGPNHRRSIQSRLMQCQTWGRLGQWDSAFQDAEIVWQRSREQLGPVHEQTLEAHGIMTGALIEAGKLEEGEKLAQDHYELTQQEFGTSHEYTIQAVTLLFDIAEKRDDPDSMAKWLEHLRGSPWEALAEEQVKAAREKKKQPDRNPDKSN